MIGLRSTMWTVIRAAREGDDSALREFASRYRAPIVSYIARRGLEADAEDLAQEVFVRLFCDGVLQKADPSKGRFRTLLLVVTRHVVGNHLERVRSEKRGAGRVHPLGSIDVRAAEPDDDFDREWVAHLLQAALARLAREHPTYHEALRLFLLEGRAYAEIAPSMGKSEGEIKNYIHRGKRALIQYLRDEVREYSTSPDEYSDELRFLSHLFLSPGNA